MSILSRRNLDDSIKDVLLEREMPVEVENDKLRFPLKWKDLSSAVRRQTMRKYRQKIGSFTDTDLFDVLGRLAGGVGCIAGPGLLGLAVSCIDPIELDKLKIVLGVFAIP